MASSKNSPRKEFLPDPLGGQLRWLSRPASSLVSPTLDEVVNSKLDSKRGLAWVVEELRF